MDISTILHEVNRWPLDERLRLIDAVWEGIGDAGQNVPLPESHREELQRRIAALDADPSIGIPWEVVKARFGKQA